MAGNKGLALWFSSLTKDQTMPLALEMWSLNHWAAREVPVVVIPALQPNDSVIQEYIYVPFHMLFHYGLSIRY